MITKNCQEENLEDLKKKQKKNNSVCVTKNDDTFSLKSKNIVDI